MKRAAILLLLLPPAGCRSARTDVRDALADTTALVEGPYVHAERSGRVEPPATRWWERFGDPALDVLVEATLEGNLDLRVAAASVREAEARVRSARGGRGPAVDLTFGARRDLVGVPGDRAYATTLTPQATIAWQVDLFGRLAAAERGRVAALLGSEADRQALAHALVAQAVRFRVRLSLLDRRLLLVREIVASRTRTLEIVEGRYERGVPGSSAVDVHLARENLAAARAALPPVQRDRDQTLLALDVLLGRKPAGSVDPPPLGSPLPDVEPPPPGVPASLLDRRPDLLASRLRVESATADVDASLAALYPDLTLSAGAGWSAGEVEDLFSADTFLANLLAGLTAPLFQAGRLRADVDGARARLEGVVAAHAAAVLQAVREVEDALVAEEGLRAELVERVRQRDEALRAENLARDRYRRGLASLLTVLDTERRRASADDAVLTLQAAVWNARIDLHLALGGDWAPVGDRALDGDRSSASTEARR